MNAERALRERKPEKVSNPEEEEKTWVTIQEAVELSGYDPAAIRKLVRRGKIPSVKREGTVEYTIHHTVRWKRDLIHVSLEDLQEWIAKPKRGPKPGQTTRK